MLLEFDNDVLTRNRQMALVMFGLAVELDLERFVMDPASIRGILMLSAKAEKRGRPHLQLATKRSERPLEGASVACVLWRGCPHSCAFEFMARFHTALANLPLGIRLPVRLSGGSLSGGSL